MSEHIVYKAAAMFGAGHFRGTIDFVKANATLLTDDTRVPALMQAFYAAREAGYQMETRELAQQIAKEEPELPSIQEYL